ncbi:MAG: universal stress protein, partial [Pseudomonadota bacterium]
MAIAKILVPVRGDGRGQSVLDHALALARPLGAHIEVLYCQAQSDDMLPYGVVVPRAVASQIAETMTTVGQGERERMRGLFREAAER